MIRIKRLINGVYFDIEIEDGLCLFYDNSGTGKTFLFNTIEAEYLLSEKRCLLLDYKDKDEPLEIIADRCNGCEVVMLDNADLYLTKELLSVVCGLCKHVLVSVKNLQCFDSVSFVLYDIEYDGNVLKCGRR